MSMEQTQQCIMKASSSRLSIAPEFIYISNSNVSAQNPFAALHQRESTISILVLLGLEPNKESVNQKFKKYAVMLYLLIQSLYFGSTTQQKIVSGCPSLHNMKIQSDCCRAKDERSTFLVRRSP